MTDRRDFLKTLGAAALTAGVARPLHADERVVLPAAPYTDPAVEELALYALQAAKDAGASYADVRFGRYRRQAVSTRERQVTGVSDFESFGCGIRTLVDGAWGFASTADVSKESLRKTAAESVTTARALLRGRVAWRRFTAARRDGAEHDA